MLPLSFFFLMERTRIYSAKNLYFFPIARLKKIKKISEKVDT